MNTRRQVRVIAETTLAEAGILAMPASDYMNKRQIYFFRQQLLAMRQDLLQNLSETSTHLRQVHVASDPMDRATQEEEQAIELRTRDRERKLLKKIDQALVLIESGDYGWCQETGDPIGLERLLARPTASLSIEAQERREKMERVYGH